MAARSGGGNGMVVAVVILSVLTLGLFVTTIVFLSQKQGAEAKLGTLTGEYNKEYVSDAERRKDDIVRWVTEAKAEKPPKTAIAYLTDSMKTVMKRTVGDEKMTPGGLDKVLGKVEGSDKSDLLSLYRQAQTQASALKTRAEAAEQARDAAQADAKNEAARTKEIDGKMKETIASLTAELNRYKDEVESYRADINATKAKMDQEVDKTREAARAREAELVGQIRESQEKQAIAQETVKRLQEQLRGKVFEGDKEYALVDGRVVGSDPGSSQYFIDIGRKQKVVLGMTFQVYTDATGIHPDAKTGDYPPGKATLEVIKIDEGSSTCRLVRETRGNPVVKGDVIANAIFDPHKKYKMLVYGNFDANGDGIYTPQEQADIEAMIREWGAEVTTELSGDIDFLVLGVKPTLPPAPPPTAPPAVVTEYVRQRGVATQYDRYFEQAQATSIPILNENRLRTLTGMGSRR